MCSFLRSLTFAIQCYTESNRNIVKAFITPYLSGEDFNTCTIISHLDPQKKSITAVFMFGDKHVSGSHLEYEFDQNKYVLKTQYSCSEDQCNSLDEFMEVLREESAKKIKGSVLAKITLIALEDGLMDVTPGRFGKRNATTFTLCAYMLALFALIAFIHMIGTFVMLCTYSKKKKS
ncbi:hypothetical protein COOONC_16429 [Cooperia oncophora]